MYDVQIRKTTIQSRRQSSTLYTGHLLAPDLAPSLSTPRAQWRQLPIKSRGLFHAYDVQIRKTMLQSRRQSSTLYTCHLLAPDLAPSLSTPRVDWRQLGESMHAMCKSGQQQYKVLDNRQHCTQARSLCTRLGYVHTKPSLCMVESDSV